MTAWIFFIITAIFVPLVSLYLNKVRGLWKKVLIFPGFIIVSSSYEVSLYQLEALGYLDLSGDWITLILWPFACLAIISIIFSLPTIDKNLRKQEEWEDILAEAKDKAGKEMLKSVSVFDRLWALALIKNGLFFGLIMLFVFISFIILLEVTKDTPYENSAVLGGILILSIFFILVWIVSRASNRKGEKLVKKYVFFLKRR